MDLSTVGEQPSALVAVTPGSHRVAWIVSYADIMTIILTFFILILSVSRVSTTRYEELAGAFGAQPERRLSDIQSELDEVVEEMGLEQHVRTELTDDGLYVELENSVLFESGSATLTDDATALLLPIGATLAGSLEPQYAVIVEGYTDDVPIHNARFRSNWELSASRAIYVMERLVEAGFEQERISVQGFADTRAARASEDAEPVDPSESNDEASALSASRARDRRVVLRVVERTEPVSAALVPAGGTEETTP